MKRTFSFRPGRTTALLASATSLVAATYGLVRLAFGLFLPDVQRDLDLDSATAGLVSSGASLAYVVGAVAGFFLAAGRPRTLVVAAGLTAAGGAAGMAASPSVTVFAVAAVVGSTGAGLASPALVSIVRRTVAEPAVARSQAIVNAGTGPGLVGAGVLALVLLPDWRLAWAVVAVVTIAAATAVLVLDPGASAGGAVPARAPAAVAERVAGSQAGARAGGGAARAGDGAGAGARGDQAGSRAVPGAGTAPPAAASRSWLGRHAGLVVAAFLLGAGSAGVWNYGRALLVDAGAGDTVSVGAWIALGLGGAAVIATAPLLGRRGPRTAWVLTTTGVALGTGVLATAPGSTVAALAACTVFGWGYTAATGALIAGTTAIDPERAPSGTSLLFVVLVLGQAAGAVVVGAIVGPAGYLAALVVAAGVALAGAAVPWGRTAQGGGRAAGRRLAACTPAP